MDKLTKHIIDTVNKYEDDVPDVQQQVINYSPKKVKPKRTATPAAAGIIKPFNNNDPSTYPVNQKKTISTWDAMMGAAKADAKKGYHKPMNEMKKILRDQYKKGGDKWMSIDEKKMIGKYESQPVEFNLNVEDITRNRMALEKSRAEDAALAEQRKKIFEKKIDDGKLEGLAYLLNTKD